jgi:hypothetical protein
MANPIVAKSSYRANHRATWDLARILEEFHENDLHFSRDDGRKPTREQIVTTSIHPAT